MSGREPDHSQQWYLLQCKARQQNRAQMHLANQGFHYYAPVHLVKCVRRGHYQARTEALFPGYLFIELNSTSDWRALYATRGVCRLVSFNGQPHPVAQDLIDALRKRFSQQTEPETLYQPGQRVVVTDGCFKHIEAIVKAVTSDDRIIVLMNILHRQQSLALPAAALARTG
ncbi:MAG: transcription/translation regulatory transformer protein RfaH [Pseudohongiella sp.]|uniref:transcription/translation regulatory transformer protein RfaH n=1 Tax=Pseudohongiella sp. TaxID=1979412 RepID=UPI00349FDA3D